MKIQFYTATSEGLTIRRWTCKRAAFEAAVGTARKAVADGRPSARVRLEAVEPFGGSHAVVLDADGLAAYAAGGAPPIADM